MDNTQDPRTEAVARVLGGLGVDGPWPTNSELGGGLTGTWDDEFRDDCMDEAQEVLTVADNADPVREGLRKLADDLRGHLTMESESVQCSTRRGWFDVVDRVEDILGGIR